MRTATSILVLLAMLVVAGTASAQDNDKVIRQEICGETWNPCCEEYVDFCYDATIVIGKDGEMKHITVSGSGTGQTSGAEYTMKGAGSMHLNSDENGAIVGQAVINQKVVGTGDAECSFRQHSLFHMTLNADGTVTVMFDKETTDCANGAEISSR